MKFDSSPQEEIAIIGFSCNMPHSPDVSTFWQNLIQGKECLTTLNADELFKIGVKKYLLENPNYVNTCGFIDNIDKFDHLFFKISSLEAACLDPQHRLFIQEAYHALENAGYDPMQYNGKIGVYAGSGPTSYYNELLLNKEILNDFQSKQLLYYLTNEKDFLSLRTAYALNLTGAALNINLASATGLGVVIKACQALSLYESDIILAGAVSIILPTHFGYIYEPENIFSVDGHCRPFDANSSGTVLSSGVGVVVLKRLRDAIRDNDTIYAVISGYSINNDGKRKVGFTAPSVIGQSECFEQALLSSNLDIRNFKMLEAHGTGTKLGDPIEVAALSNVFNKYLLKKDQCSISSVKANIGHPQSAAGIAGLIKLILSIYNNTIPVAINFNTPNPAIDFSSTPFFVNKETFSWNENVRIGGVNSLAMGGINTHIIVRNYNFPYNLHTKYKDTSTNVLILSATTDDALRLLISSLLNFLRNLDSFHQHDTAFFNEICYTLQKGRRNLPIKKFWICSNVLQAIDLISENQCFPDCNDYTLLNFINTWLAGRDVDWSKLYTKIPKRIALPLYPFANTSHWFFESLPFRSIQNSTNTKIFSSNNKINNDSILDTLQDIFKTTLKCSNFGLADNFEKCQIDSLLAIEIISKIHSKYNININIDLFLKLKNILNLAGYINNYGENQNFSSSLKLLRTLPSSNIPIFFIHPGNGELYCYDNLTKKLHPHFKSYGIANSVYNDLYSPLSFTIPNLAKTYFHLVKSISFSGPYILAGWSLGGAVAFELSDLLMKNGDFVSHVFLIDSWAFHNDFFKSQKYILNSYLKYTFNERLTFGDTGIWGELMSKRIKALAEYTPKVIDSNVYLFKARIINEEYKEIDTFDNHWQQYCKNPISVININANHDNILSYPFVETLSEKFNEKLSVIFDNNLCINNG